MINLQVVLNAVSMIHYCMSLEVFQLDHLFTLNTLIRDSIGSISVLLELNPSNYFYSLKKIQMPQIQAKQFQ